MRIGNKGGRICAVVIAVGIAATAIAACGGSSTQGTTSGHTTSAQKRVSLTFLDAGPTTYGLAMEAQARQTAAAQNINLTIENANFDPQRQLAQCQDAISSHQTQGLMVYAVSNVAAIPCVRAAASAGIKVAAVESQIGPKVCTANGHQVPGISFELATCPQDAAHFMAELAVEACGSSSPCQVGLMTGPPNLAFVPQEISAFEADLQGHPNVQIVAHYAPGYDAPQAAAAATRTLLLTHPDTKVIVEDDDSSAAGVAQALQQAGKTQSTKLIGGGGDSEAMARVKDGTEFGSVISTPRTDSEYALEALAKVVRGEKLSKTELHSQDLSPLGPDKWAVTKANVAQFTPQW